MCVCVCVCVCVCCGLGVMGYDDMATISNNAIMFNFHYVSHAKSFIISILLP